MKDPIVESQESPLKRMRKKRKVRQADLASLAGVSKGHLSEVETGIAMPNPKLSRLLAALDLLEPQKSFIRMTRIRARQTLYHQLIVEPGGGVHEFTNIENEQGH